MSSLLNVSNGSSKSEEFSLNYIEMLADITEQNWFKRAHIGKILGLKDIEPSTRGLDKREIGARHDIKAAPQQNRSDEFLSKKGVQYVISRIRKSM